MERQDYLNMQRLLSFFCEVSDTVFTATHSISSSFEMNYIKYLTLRKNTIKLNGLCLNSIRGKRAKNR